MDNEAASDTLDRLKNWRTHLPPEEHGVKCMMMDGWQELSGKPAPGRRPDDPNGPEAFWKDLRARDNNGMGHDLRDKEMLCAIAFVKRRFARHFAGLSETTGDWTLNGWPLPAGVPSVHYLAAAPWLAKLLEAAAKDETLRTRMKEFHDAALALTGGYGEWDSNIRCVREADGEKRWKALDGTVFFDAMLENPRLWAEKSEQAKQLLGKLKGLRTQAGLEPVSPFYAVLLMDGDELGKQMSEPDNQIKITHSLAAFTLGVPNIVDKHDGFLVYAGGDDVLALLPLKDALACAADLRRHYLDCFASSGIPTSLSGAIEYAHIKMPLGKVLADAHDLLDNLAKDGRGRDAIACRVWKPGGQALEWAMPWECALQEGQVVIERLAEDFRQRMSSEEGEFSSKFFYRIRERFELLNPPRTGGQKVLGDDEALDLVAMEYLNSGPVRDKKMSRDEARARVRPLLEQCCPVTRDKTKAKEHWPKSERREADGALLVRFLANKGVER